MSTPAGWVLVEYRHGVISNYWLSTEREYLMQERINRVRYEMEIAAEIHAVPPSRYVLYALTPDHPCCHTTGPNHHPACTPNRTEQT